VPATVQNVSNTDTSLITRSIIPDVSSRLTFHMGHFDLRPLHLQIQSSNMHRLIDEKNAGSASSHGLQDGTTQLVRSMGLFSATAIVSGSMVGSGIFIVSAEMSRTLQSPALLIASWIVTAAMTMIGALSYGELAAMMPKAGGQYVYLRESLGPLLGFLYG
jgi:amino acid permease